MSLGNLIYSNLKKFQRPCGKFGTTRWLFGHKMRCWMCAYFSLVPEYSNRGSKVLSTFYLWSLLFSVMALYGFPDTCTTKNILFRGVNHHIIFVNVVRSVFTCWVNFDPIYIHIFCIPCTALIFDKLLLSDAIFGQWFC